MTSMPLTAVLGATLTCGVAAAADPAAVLEAARNAISTTGAVEYHASLRTEGPMAESIGLIPDAHVVVGPPHGTIGMPMPRPFIIEGELARGDERLPLGAAFDGNTVLAFVPSERGVIKQTLRPGAGFAMVEAYEMLLPGLGAIPLQGRPTAELRDGGQATVAGRPCDVVEIFEVSKVPPQPGGEAPTAYELIRRIAIGTDDHMPRRSEAVFTPIYGERRGETNRIIAELAGDITPVTSTPELWTIATPDGWRLMDLDAPARRPAGLAVGVEAPDWTLADGDGNEHSLADLRGRVVVVDFWATWCGPCKRAMPGLQRLHERFTDQPVTIVGISANERGGDPIGYMKKQGFGYLGLVKGERVAQAYGVSSIPHLYVIAPDGTIAHSAVGFSPALEESLAGVIESLLDS